MSVKAKYKLPTQRYSNYTISGGFQWLVRAICLWKSVYDGSSMCRDISAISQSGKHHAAVADAILYQRQSSVINFNEMCNSCRNRCSSRFMACDDAHRKLQDIIQRFFIHGIWIFLRSGSTTGVFPCLFLLFSFLLGCLL